MEMGAEGAARRGGRSRRGGVGDAGGLGSNGELPVAAPVQVTSDAELATEVAAVAAGLDATADWTQRVEALLHLEGLLKGGAANLPKLPDLLVGLRDVLAVQLQERRSAVSRQACHVVGLLATACADRFEPLATHLLPMLLKALAMGIQVVSEAADACMHTILRCCHSPKLLPKLCTTVTADRNGKLRQSAAEYLLQVLEEWQPAVYERQVGELERCILAAAQDAQAETRAVGRCMYAAYACACPGGASALLLRLEKDRALAEKLAAAMQSYVPGMLIGSVSQPPSRQSSAGASKASSPHSGASLSRAGSGLGGAMRPLAVPRLALSSLAAPAPATGSATSATSTHTGVAAVLAAPWQQQQQVAAARENLPDNRHDQVAAAVAAQKPPTGRRPEAVGGPLPRPATAREHAASRRSMGGAALRISLAAAREEMAREREEEGSVGAAAASLSSRGPRRVSVNPGALRVMRPVPLPAMAADGSTQALANGASTARSTVASLDHQPSLAESEASVLSGLGGSYAYYEEQQQGPALSQLLAQTAKAGVDWQGKVERFQALEAAVAAAGPQAMADMASNAERLVAVLLDGAGDAHFKVASAALQALGAGLAGPSARVFEPHLDRLVPALFARVVDAKEQVRALVGAALASLSRHHAPDLVAAGMAKALAANKAPRVRCAVMDHYSGAVTSSDSRPLLDAAGSGLRALVAGALALAGDKNPDIRRSAVLLVATAYKAGDAEAVLAALGTLPPTSAESVQKAVAAAVQALDVRVLEQQPEAELAAPAAEAAPLPAAVPGTSTSASRRCSGQGVASCRSISGSGSSLATASDEVPRPAPSQGTPVADAPGTTSTKPAWTPAPPSPFAWRAESASPAQPACAADQVPVHVEAEEQEAVEPELSAAGEQDAAAAAIPPLASLDGVMEGQLRRLLGQLQAGPASEVLQGLSRLAHTLPASAWATHFNQVLAAIFVGLDSGSSMLQEAALMLVRDLSAALPTLFDPALPSLLPRLLACTVQQTEREVALAADKALEVVVRHAGDVSACAALLASRLPAEGEEALTTDLRAADEMFAVIRVLQQALHRLSAAQVARQLPALLPGLRAGYGSAFANVRKASIDCLVQLWGAVGEAALRPYLAPLSSAQRKLVEIYSARAAQPAVTRA